MSQRKIAALLCVVFGFTLHGCTKGESAPPKASTVNVYYFHRTARCPSCEKIEALTEKAVEGAFAEELATGKMQWRAVNIEESQNKHFEDNYRLSSQSVVLSETRDGKEVQWKNLDKVWDLLDDDDAFVAYIQREVHEFVDTKEMKRP